MLFIIVNVFIYPFIMKPRYIYLYIPKFTITAIINKTDPSINISNFWSNNKVSIAIKEYGTVTSVSNIYVKKTNKLNVPISLCVATNRVLKNNLYLLHFF